MNMLFGLSVATAASLAAASAFAVPTFFGPSAYLSSADTPVGFYAGGSPSFLDDFEDGPGIQGGISASAGSRIGPGAFNGSRDSVDGDDGIIDGSGVTGSSWFSSNGAAGVMFTFGGPTLPTAFGLVWTDGSGTITFKAFDGGDLLIFQQTFSGIPDGSFSGTTAEDRFFGITSAAGVKSIYISNTSGGIEVDHVQYGEMAVPVPEPASAALLIAGLAAVGGLARRSKG